MAPPIRAAYLLAFLFPSPLFAQNPNPADVQRSVDEDQVSTTTVTAKRVSDYREEDLIGPYEQPQWTAVRRFPTTRVYVRPPGTFEFEYWKRIDFPSKTGPAEVVTQYELEMGLPGRFQVDLYMVSNQEGNGGPSSFNEEMFEVRWALADWGKIWGNPTLYLELATRDQESDVVEGKLLLGGDLSPGWHWGSNLVFEHETGGERTNEHEITAGVSRVLKDERLSLGAELKASLTNTRDDRTDFTKELLVGPSLQYRPTRNVHMDLVTMAGIGSDSPDAEAFFVLGYEF